jgi:hypothetical protein
MTEADEPQTRQFAIATHEQVPLDVISVGLSPLPDEEDAWFGTVFADLSTRPDIMDLVEAHREGEGDCQTSWFTAPEYGPRFCLLLAFTHPMKVNAILAFDLVRHGGIVDCFINGKGRIAIVPGIRGENFQEVSSQPRARVLIPVGASVAATRWNTVWIETVATEVAIERDEAERMVRYMRLDTRMRATIPDMPPLHQVRGMFHDEDSQNLVIMTSQLIVNRLRRDMAATVDSFDKYFWEDVEALSDEFSTLMAQIVQPMLKAGRSGDQLVWSCSQLIGNSLENIVAALELLRSGRRLQPGILLRTSVEASATAAYLFYEPSNLGRFLAGKLDSAAAVGKAKAVIPFIAQFWGHLSQNFTHLGHLYQRVQAAEEYESKDDAGAKTALMAINLAVMIAWTVAELVFYDAFSDHRYWSKQGPGQFALDIREDVRRRMQDIEDKYSLASD